MRIPFCRILFIFFFPLLANTQTIPVDIGYSNLDIFWDSSPLKTYKFQNGDKIDIVNSHKQWFKNCDSRKPSVWVYSDDAQDRVVYLYNYFAITDKRKIVSSGYEIPTRDLLTSLNQEPQLSFPFSEEPGVYLAVNSELKRTQLVNQPYYFWTSTQHESNFSGEEIAYIGSADKNSRQLSVSTGDFCEGYPVVCFKAKAKPKYDYELLLPSKYNELRGYLYSSVSHLDWSLHSERDTSHVRLSLEGYLKFDNSGRNNSEGFGVAYDSETKIYDLVLNQLDDSLRAWPYYPQSFGSPVPVSQTIRLDLIIKRLSETRDSSLRYNDVSFDWLEDRHSAVLREAMNRGSVRRVLKKTIYNGQIDSLGVQYTLDKVSFRSPLNCAFAPLGQATRIVTSHYMKSYKKPAISNFLSISVPLLLLSTGYSYYQQMELENAMDESQSYASPSNVNRLANLKKQTAILAGAASACIVVDLSFGIHFSRENMRLKRRFQTLKEDSYPNGISFVLSNSKQ